jgi:enoyl-[acyl-carrier protein] reductase II
MKKTQLCKLLNIELPIIQAGMVWVSGGKLAAASANAGCLGVIGAGSMKLELLEQHISKAQSLTKKPLALNIPIMYHGAQEQMDLAISKGIKIFITSAGSPKKFTKYLKDKNCIVIHVASSPELAVKCEQAGVDAVIVEGFEAGGHNGRDEITSLVLIPQSLQKVSIPVIAAGGFGDGKSIAAAIALGAQGVQMGTRFMLTQESSAHEKYKNLLTESESNSTMLMMKSYIPVRLFKNKFYEEINQLEKDCAPKERIIEHLGKGRAKSGMLDGDLENGELEVGQICSYLDDIPSVSDLVSNLKAEYNEAINNLMN